MQSIPAERGWYILYSMKEKKEERKKKKETSTARYMSAQKVIAPYSATLTLILLCVDPCPTLAAAPCARDAST